MFEEKLLFDPGLYATPELGLWMYIFLKIISLASLLHEENQEESGAESILLCMYFCKHEDRCMILPVFFSSPSMFYFCFLFFFVCSKSRLCFDFSTVYSLGFQFTTYQITNFEHYDAQSENID